VFLTISDLQHSSCRPLIDVKHQVFACLGRCPHPDQHGHDTYNSAIATATALFAVEAKKASGDGCRGPFVAVSTGVSYGGVLLHPAHHLMAPSTESRTRTYKAPVHPNRESKLPNPVSHQTHAAYAPHPTLCVACTTRPTMV
jgi:hypothetical protein